MHCNTLNCLIPAPANAVATAGFFPLRRAKTLAFAPEAAKSAGKLRAAFARMRAELADAADAAVTMQTSPALPDEAWQLEITPDRIVLSASEAKGFAYGTGALIQMLMIAAREDFAAAYLDCGTVEDAPRFAWRGFMLDSARRFQRADTVKQVLRLLAEFRINSFHWHLTDNDSWRFASKHLPDFAGKGERDDGLYSRKDLCEVAEEGPESLRTQIAEKKIRFTEEGTTWSMQRRENCFMTG